MFKKILIANRGEIAVPRPSHRPRPRRRGRRRLLRSPTAPPSTSAYADEAYCIGPAARDQSYLNADGHHRGRPRVRRRGHPPRLRLPRRKRRLRPGLRQRRHRLHRPPVQAIAAMGDKLAARRLMKGAGVPVVPGSPELPGNRRCHGRHSRDRLPVMVKAAAGGGGRGMRIVELRRRPRGRRRQCPQGSPGGFRQRRHLHREALPNASATSRSR